jgi:hypothetical protein
MICGLHVISFRTRILESTSSPSTHSLSSPFFAINSLYVFLCEAFEVKNRPNPQSSIKSKAVPLHAMEALGGRGGIAPTQSVVSVTPRPRFTPGERTTGTHCTGGWVGPRAGLDTEAAGKILCPRRGSNPDRPVVQPVVRHYTAWATRLLQRSMHV